MKNIDINKFEFKSTKLHKELDKCSTYLHSTSKALEDTIKDENHVEVCHEFVTINYLNKTMKKFSDNIEKAEKYAVFWENDYQFVFQKNDFTKSLKEIITQNVQFNLTTDKKDSKFQDLGKIEESSIIYVGGNNNSELSLINYNMSRMSRSEKGFDVPKDDKNFPISGFRYLSDFTKNIIYIFGGKTDGNYTTNRAYYLNQVNRSEGKFMEVHKLSNMQACRAYHGACWVDFKKNRYIWVAGGEQSAKKPPGKNKDNFETESMTSSGYEIEIPRKWIADWEVYDIQSNKWFPLPDLCNKKSNISLWALAGTSIVYCFGGWNGKTSVNSIERIDISSYIHIEEDLNEVNSDGEEFVKQTKSSKLDKSNSEGISKQIKGTWTSIVVREAGTLDTSPNYRIFSAWNSIGCVALDDAWIMLFGGKENMKDGEQDQCYMFFGANRVKSANPNDNL